VNIKTCVFCAFIFPSLVHGSEPRFEDYPPTEVYTGKPVPPLTPVGPINVSHETNFAGHFVVIATAPGGDHLVLDVIDAKTGRVSVPPLFPKRFISRDCPNCTPTNPLRFGGASFRVDSRLMILERACPTDGFERLLQFVFMGCSKYYFVWDDRSFKLLR
jgi:hypothetical protein